MKLKWGMVQKSQRRVSYRYRGVQKVNGDLDWGHVVEMRSPGKDERRIWREREITGEHSRDS